MKQSSIEGSFSAPLSQAIQKECNKFISAIRLVPQNFLHLKKIKATGGEISVSDLLAYQIGWGKLLIGWYEAGLKNEMPEMPGEGFTTWDYTGLAEHFYNKYHYAHSSKQIEEFCHIVQRILEIVEKEYQTKNLDKVGIWNWCTLPSGKQWPLSKWIRVNTASPYKRAVLLVRKFS